MRLYINPNPINSKFKYLLNETNVWQPLISCESEVQYRAGLKLCCIPFIQLQCQQIFLYYLNKHSTLILG